MSIPPRFLDEIRSRLNLSDIIGKRVKVTRAGREYKACCPFHREKTPSFTINDEKGFYHCFGCGAHGDVIGFLMQHDNMSFIDVVETLAAQAGLRMPSPDPAAVRQAEKSRGLHEMMDAACAWFEMRLCEPAHEPVLAYLEKRGLGEDIRARFRIGYAPEDGQALRRHLAQSGFSDAQMAEAGLLKDSQKKGEPYAFFRDRVMFPVADRRGRVVAFGGRILPEGLRPPDRAGFKPPKYINSPDTPLFDKGRTLYAESMARQAARAGHTPVVAEGYMDVIACHAAGFLGAVAPMGTALTEAQILSLWSMTDEHGKTPVLCFDGDNAGRRAASRACERVLPLLKPGKSVRFAFLPEGEDPDSLLRAAGRQGLQGVLSASLPLFDFLWATHTAGRAFETPEARAGLESDLRKAVAAIADPEIQRHYKALVQSRIAETFFRPAHKSPSPAGGARGGAGRGGKPGAAPGIRLRPPGPARAGLPEKILLAGVLNHPLIYQEVEEDFGRFQIAHARLDALRQKMVAVMEDEAPLDRAEFQLRLRACGFAQELDDILNESVYVHAGFCRPESDSGAAETVDPGPWRLVLADFLASGHEREMRQEWRDVLLNASGDDEEKLMGMMRARQTGEGF